MRECYSHAAICLEFSWGACVCSASSPSRCAEGMKPVSPPFSASLGTLSQPKRFDYFYIHSLMTLTLFSSCLFLLNAFSIDLTLLISVLFALICHGNKRSLNNLSNTPSDQTGWQSFNYLNQSPLLRWMQKSDANHRCFAIYFWILILQNERRQGQTENWYAENTARQRWNPPMK